MNPATLLRRFAKFVSRSASISRRFQPQIEMLESRVVPYSTTGDAWQVPQLITISFVPDGTNLGGVSSNLFSTFNARFGSAATWENQFLKAAQQWAAQTNINFSVVSDSGAASGSGSYAQGSPTMGDIRIGGYNFSNSSALAAADFPPSSNNYSVAGDIVFNTGVAWNIGSDYDVYTVAMHEIGHALGLDHSTASNAVMFASYTNTKTGLSSDDIAGIRNIYSDNNPRSADAYGDANNSLANASNITNLISSTSHSAVVSNLNLNTTSDQEYFEFTVPSGSSSTLTVTVQSSGLSLLAPEAWLYNGSQTQLTSASGLNQYGTTLTLTASGVTPGQTYYIKVAGANTTAFGTGAYALTLNMGSGAAPTVARPNTEVANGTPLHAGGGAADSTLLGLLLGGIEGLLGQGIFGGNGDLDVVDSPRIRAEVLHHSFWPSSEEVDLVQLEAKKLMAEP